VQEKNTRILESPLVMMSIYLICVAGVLAYGMYVYGGINWADNGSPLLPPQIWGANEAYRHYLQNTGRILAIMLGVFSAAAGKLLDSNLLGFGFMTAAAAVTSVAWSLLPSVYFPGGSMTAWLFWLAGNFYLLMGTWLVLTALQVIHQKVGGKST